MPKTILHTPLRVPDLLIPNENIDLYKWATIACDQFTSNPAYWDEVNALVSQVPSARHLILPEVYLEREDYAERLATISTTAKQYLEQGIFDTHNDALLLVSRQSPRTKCRKGLILQVDLSQYDPNPNANTPIKSTEAIVASRLPKRIEVREQSKLDLSHVLMVYEDKDYKLISEIEKHIEKQAYKTDLMMDGGHVIAQFCDVEKSINIISHFFEEKAKSQKNNILMAVGDGNHSLMSAKQVWHNSGADMNSPERWALVELVNIYDEGIDIEPIHRVLFNASDELLQVFQTKGSFSDSKTSNKSVCFIYNGNTQYWTHNDPTLLSIESIEDIIQSMPHLYSEVDFIHSEKEVESFAHENNKNMGIIFPEFDRDSVFKMVYKNGLFPRKSFSLGEDKDKKYYIETCLRA